MIRFTTALLMLVSGLTQAAEIRLKDVGPATRPGTIEIRGVAAGTFDPSIWERGKLNLVRDVRFPLIEPKMGRFRNIYAPSIVRSKTGWTIFYGAWDGTATANDRIHRGDCDPEFLSIKNRHTVIEHGDFTHVCNVNVTRDDQGGLVMMCTAYPDAKGCNKPIVFKSKDGEHWNGPVIPHVAKMIELITLDGYPNYANADINGMNVLLRDQGKWRMYFGDFHNPGKTFAAASDDARHFTFEADVMPGTYNVNDVKKLKGTDGNWWYLAGFHNNGDRLFYSISKDPLRLSPPRTLIDHAGDADRFIVAIGFVVDGDRVLGFLYGAGAVGSLDHNRIFAVWLQKKLIVQVDGKTIEPAGALGPDRQVFISDRPIRAQLKLMNADGETEIGSGEDHLKPGRAYKAE